MDMPAAWDTAGAYFGRDGLLYLPEWRRGFDVHELRALFWRCQMVGPLEWDIKRLQRDLDTASTRIDELERLAAFYRRQCTLESRLGLALSRIAG